MPASTQDGSNSTIQQSRNSTASNKDRISNSSQKEEATDAFLNDGFVLEETDSDDSDMEQDTREGSAQEGKGASPTKGEGELFFDDETVKGELGGDVSPTGTKEVAKEEIEGKGQNSNEEETKEAEKTKKKNRRLKKVTETRTAFDGRELVFVTECTQTDWKWKDVMERTGKGNLLAPSSVKPESRQTISQARTDDESLMDDRTGTDYTPFSLQPNDEFGIPMLDMSSDSDSSEDESPKKVKPQRHHLPTIGPPQILKYIRESDQLERETDRASSDLEDDYRNMESADYVLDEQGRPAGMFSGPCEFCGKKRLEEDMSKKNEKISIKVHGHHGSKQARKLAKEQAVQRMRERELARRQQEASGLQAAFYQSAAGSQGGGASRAPKPNQGGGGMIFKDMDYQDTDVEKESYDGPLPGMADQALDGGKRGGGRRGEDGGGGLEGSDADRVDGADKKSSRRGAGNSRGGGESKSGTGVSGHFSGRGHSQLAPTGALGPVSSLSSFAGLGGEVARQMKTINYQLSSQRCLEEGWTLRAPSPLDLDNPENEVFVPEPLHPSMIASGKLHGRQLVEKFYPDGKKFITMFPDGTGNVFYPSGRLGIIISSISLGKNTYVVQDDSDNPEILAVFEPNGNGCCYFSNGKVRLCYDQMGGTELDISGGRKRVWSWRDQETHVHAPPFQPIVFGMNRYLGVRFMAQESIALTLTGRKRSCRFNVGARLKLVAPEYIQPKGIDEHFLFISERKVRVETILNKVTNLLKFPKSPKVDRILPPLSVASHQQRVEKMSKEYMATLPALGPPLGAGAAGIASGGGNRSGRQPKKPVKQTRLSPLDVPSVTVN
ncbi:glutamate-rich protein 6-like [Plakobranchus ocellatus]|uniref:Glutamate-rich protein 6-like n=1 Tax=Plakobranchus ocellatus TaxID=259542 RepID=A0AAV4D299_9GAST|nr:glutamate-rich protein 6-like [Plakobranchus ocellatus]